MRAVYLLALFLPVQAVSAAWTDYVGLGLEVRWITSEWDGGAVGGGHVDATGIADISVSDAQVTIEVDDVAGYDEWAVSVDIDSSVEGSGTFIWNGEGWMGDVMVGDGVMRIGVAGNGRGPGEGPNDRTVAGVVLGMIGGFILWQIFVTSWRRHGLWW